jgi:hypothetical protein
MIRIRRRGAGRRRTMEQTSASKTSRTFFGPSPASHTEGVKFVDRILTGTDPRQHRRARRRRHARRSPRATHNLPRSWMSQPRHHLRRPP